MIKSANLLHGQFWPQIWTFWIKPTSYKNWPKHKEVTNSTPIVHKFQINVIFYWLYFEFYNRWKCWHFFCFKSDSLTCWVFYYVCYKKIKRNCKIGNTNFHHNIFYSIYLSLTKYKNKTKAVPPMILITKDKIWTQWVWPWQDFSGEPGLQDP